MNAMCENCARLNRGCTGCADGPYTGCIRRAVPDKAYTVRIGGRWYALMMDTFARYVFGIGRDTGRFAEIAATRGTTAGRNAAIMAACSPFDTWRDAYTAASATGCFAGQLFEN